PGRQRLCFRGGHEFAVDDHGAGGGDFFAARVVGVDLVGDGAGRGGGVGAAEGRAVAHRGAFFDRERGARFAFAGERGRGRGGRWWWRWFSFDRLDLRATRALRFAIAGVAGVGGLPVVG